MAENSAARQKASGKYKVRSGQMVRKKSTPYSKKYRGY